MPAPGSIAEAVVAQQHGEMTAVDLLRQSMDAVADLDGELQAIVATDDAAIGAAEEADRVREAGRSIGPLHGVPVAVKDIIDMSGLPTRCGSAASPTNSATVDAPVVRRLREAGAVVFAKTVAHEFAFGVYSPPTANPWNVEHIPGGSSGGSGAAVAAGMTLVALGSDTGGSIRIPAALCGVAGMKPTYGLVPKSGVAALSWSLDHVGPLGRTVADCAVVLDVIAGYDDSDPSTLEISPPRFSSELGQTVEGLRIGVILNHFHAPIQPDVAAAFDAALAVLRAAGAELVDVEIPELTDTLAAEFGLVIPESSAYHHDLLRDRPGMIGEDLRPVLAAGCVLPAETYLKARSAREIIRTAVRRAFEDHALDAVVTPQLPATAARKDQLSFAYPSGDEDVTAGYVRTTAPFNLTGQPALSVPAGFDRVGLPIGLQVAGRPLGDATVLRIGHAFEQATEWHLRRPPIRAHSR